MAHEIVEQMLTQHPDISATRSAVGQVTVTTLDQEGRERIVCVIQRVDGVLLSIPSYPDEDGFTYMYVKPREGGGLTVNVKNPDPTLDPPHIVEQSRLGLALLSSYLNTPQQARHPMWKPRVYDFSEGGYTQYDHRPTAELLSQPVREYVQHWPKPQSPVGKLQR